MVFGGVSGENVIVFDGLKIEVGSLCCDNEFVCYKMLDVLGDLYIVGVLIFGVYKGYCVGYVLINVLLCKLFVDLMVYCFVECFENICVKLSGMGVYFFEVLVVV